MSEVVFFRDPYHAVPEVDVGPFTSQVTLAASSSAPRKRFMQKLTQPDRRTFVGSGKLDEILQYIENHKEISLVIFDDDLTGKQTNIIEEHLKVKIVDRSSLILDIFASRAQTAQAKTQVELAQMQYMLPRLTST